MTTRVFTIFLATGHPQRVATLRRLLGQVPGWRVTLRVHEDESSAHQGLEEGAADIYMLDGRIGAVTGLEFYQRNRELIRQPAILLTDAKHEDEAMVAIVDGFADYLLADSLTRSGLFRAITGALERAALKAIVAEQERLRRELQRQSITDDLTGLYNRRFVRRTLLLETDRSSRYGLPLAVLMLDVDHFKQVNDSWGHPAGDRVLQSIADTIREQLRRTDIVARYGGEEFLAVLTNTSALDARRAADRILRSVAEARHDADDGRTFSVTCSIGLAELDESIQDWNTLVKLADQALYEAKNDGRNRVVSAR